MLVNVTILENNTVVRQYTMDYSDQQQRRVLAIQSKAALEAGQTVVTTKREG